MRYLIALLVLSGTLAFGGAASARDIHLHIKMSAQALQQACKDVNGSFSQGPQRYGCGTDCKGQPGTECIVTCEAGQALHRPGDRRPRAAYRQAGAGAE